MRRCPRVESAMGRRAMPRQEWALPGRSRAHRREQVRRKRMPMRWCRSQKPAKSTASAFPVVAGCHPAVLTLTRPPENGSDPEGIAESAFRSVCPH